MKTVFAALSGGVDSSVAAALLKRRGFAVVGVYMKPYQPEAGISNFQFPIFNSDCLWEQDREEAARVAAKLNIPFLTWDFSKEYERGVVNYMVKGYKSGITPNPDVMCNKYIKFGLFLDRALKHGADFIATGHYARLGREILNPKSEILKKSKTEVRLFKSRDTNKDQSYFLWTLTQKQLKHSLFPIGNYTKPEVRKLAKKFGLPNWDKKDSQGICFIGPLNIKDFLKGRIKPQKGKILTDGKVIGEHDGIFYYTIGEKIAVSSRPYFVIAKNAAKNIIYVSDKKEDRPKKEFKFSGFNLIGNSIHLPVECRVKTRYLQNETNVILKKGRAELKKPLFDLTSGQSAVFYKGNRVLGGGIIK